MNWLKQIYNRLFGTISSSRLVRPAPSRWARPSIEWLEGREVPATCNVNVTNPTGEVTSCVQLSNDTSADNQANDSMSDAGDLAVDRLTQVEANNTLFAENTAILGTDVYGYVLSQGPNLGGVDFLTTGWTNLANASGWCVRGWRGSASPTLRLGVRGLTTGCQLRKRSSSVSSTLKMGGS